MLYSLQALVITVSLKVALFNVSAVIHLALALVSLAVVALLTDMLGCAPAVLSADWPRLQNEQTHHGELQPTVTATRDVTSSCVQTGRSSFSTVFIIFNSHLLFPRLSAFHRGILLPSQSRLDAN